MASSGDEQQRRAQAAAAASRQGGGDGAVHPGDGGGTARPGGGERAGGAAASVARHAGEWADEDPRGPAAQPCAAEGCLTSLERNVAALTEGIAQTSLRVAQELFRSRSSEAGRAGSSLALAERLVREGEDRIARLEAVVAEMAGRGHHDAARTGRGLLERFRRTVATCRAALDARRADWDPDASS